MILSHALLIYLLLGASAGVLAGLLGVGGGLLIVPTLAYVYMKSGFDQGIIMQLAVGTSLATIAATAVSSTLSHHKKGAVLWPVFLQLAPAIFVGVGLGAFWAVNISSSALKQLFGVVEVLIAAQMLVRIKLSPRSDETLRQSSQKGHLFAGFGIGIFSALIGIGGGSITVPYLTWRMVGIRQAIATSAACGLPIAVMGCISYIALGLDQPQLPRFSTGFVYWPSVLVIGVSSVIMAPLGVRLAHRLPATILNVVFALLLVVLGVWMIID